MTKEMAKAFVKRWEAVHDQEIRLLRETSFEEKYLQLMTLLSWVKIAHVSSKDQRETTNVAKRWEKLRAAMKNG